MEKSTKTTVIGGIIALVAIVGLLFFAQNAPTGPGKLDGFAKCLKDSGAVFYGAFWCPHCQNQKAMFGSSKKYLPYVECSTPDMKGQTGICIEKGIKSYPTWFYPDMSSSTGEVQLSDLSAKTSCPLPKE